MMGDVSFSDERASRKKRNYFPERIFDVDALARILEGGQVVMNRERRKEKGWEREHRGKKEQRVGRLCGIILVLGTTILSPVNKLA